jgi:hypothetical protein
MQSIAVSADQSGTNTHVVPELDPVRLYLHLVLYRIQNPDSLVVPYLVPCTWYSTSTRNLVRTCVASCSTGIDIGTDKGISTRYLVCVVPIGRRSQVAGRVITTNAYVWCSTKYITNYRYQVLSFKELPATCTTDGE